MATIISEGITGDGYDVSVILSNGESKVFHFLSQPTNTQEKVDELENSILTPLTLEIARGGAKSRLDMWYQNKLSEGIDIGGIILKATIYDQSRLANLTTGINIALILQVIQPTDSLPTPIWDINGTAHSLTVTQFLGGVLQYMGSLGAIESKYSYYNSLIISSSSPEELENMVIE